MTSFPTRLKPFPDPIALVLLTAAAIAIAGMALAAEPDSVQQGSPPQAGAAATRLVEAGFDNVSVHGDTTIAFENQRWRHSAEARGRAMRFLTSGPGAFPAAGANAPVRVVERRLGMAAAMIADTGGAIPERIRYPGESGFGRPPGGPVLSPTSRTLDLVLRPIFTYELGRIFEPVLLRLDVEPELQYNPWPGARATASLIIPVRNDFEFDPLHPDEDRTRPGLVTLEQFGWLGSATLVSACGGLLGDNRYGLSIGAARPWAEGQFLLDAQADLTGYVAFPATGTEYSSPDVWTGFVGLTWRPPALDLGIRLRAQRFLYKDQGAELELRRSMGDLDVAFFLQRTDGLYVHGVRLVVPIPPLVRPTRWPVRALPVDRLPLNYQDEAASIGRSLAGVASREAFLRQLDRPALEANAYRYAGADRPRRAPGPQNRVSLIGMTGFVNTPWCGVMGDKTFEAGYNTIPRGAAYDHRGQFRNDVYYVALGFLPRIETGLRWTVIPGLKAFSDIVPDSKLTDADRMFSGRVSLFEPAPRHPGLAIGIEDAVGTRRFHSTYVVSGIPLQYQRLQGRVSLGYAPRVLMASRHTLDGCFGAFEASPWRPVAASIEYDTERWNTALAFDVGLGLRVRAAWIAGKYASVGAGWFVAL